MACQKGHKLPGDDTPAICITCGCKDKFINLVRSVCESKFGKPFTFEPSIIKQIAGMLTSGDGVSVICYAKRPGKVDLSPLAIQIQHTERAFDVHRAIEAQINKIPEQSRKKITESAIYTKKEYKKIGALPFLPMYYTRIVEQIGLDIEGVSTDILDDM